MDEQLIRRIQREGAEALLDRGVSLPLLDIRIPFLKSPLRFRLTMKRPTMSRQLKIAHTYLSMNMTLEQFSSINYDAQMAFIAQHGKKFSRIIALTIEQKWLPTSVIAWFVRHFMRWDYQKGAFEKFVTLMGTESFIPIIRSVEMTNPMKLRLSQKKEGS